MENRLLGMARPARAESEPSDSDTLVDRSRDRLLSLSERAGRFVAAHPAWCLGAAFSAGALLGWLVKRR